jgi:hypothetical protein
MQRVDVQISFEQLSGHCVLKHDSREASWIRRAKLVETTKLKTLGHSNGK